MVDVSGSNALVAVVDYYSRLLGALRVERDAYDVGLRAEVKRHNAARADAHVLVVAIETVLIDTQGGAVVLKEALDEYRRRMGGVVAPEDPSRPG